MPRRVCLSVPAADPRRTAKAGALGADEVVFDLEDSVPPEEKARGREFVRSLAWERTGANAAVRVNAVGTPWCHEDIIACAENPLLHSIVLPKAESAHDLAFVERLLAGAEAASGRPEPLRVQALIETAKGLSRVEEIAAASPRLDALVLGYADLAASLGRAQSASWESVRDRVVTAARTHDLEAVDGPHLGIADDEDFRAHLRTARAVGFDGTWVIHPCQVPAAREAFTPSEAELSHARRVLDSLAEASARGVGAVVLDGQMLDEALAVNARRVLKRAGL